MKYAPLLVVLWLIPSLLSCTKDEDFNFVVSVYNNEPCPVDFYLKESESSGFQSQGTINGNETLYLNSLKAFQLYKGRLVKEGLSQANYFYEFEIYSNGERLDFNVVPYN